MRTSCWQVPSDTIAYAAHRRDALHMAGDGKSRDQVKQRVRPILDHVAVAGLRAWLKAIGLTSSANTRPGITDLIVGHIMAGRLVEEALETALIGFEEASEMRIYPFRMEDTPSGSPSKWMPTRLEENSIPVKAERSFSGKKIKPMTPVYALLEGGQLRVKWAEQHESLRIDPHDGSVKRKEVLKRAVLIADFEAGTAELRLNPPENRHSYEDATGRTSAEPYYSAYIEKARTLLGATLVPVELRSVAKQLVLEEDPRVTRIHIDHHANQKNTKMKTYSSRADVRDDPDWQLAYKKNGHTWAWERLSFYWLPAASSGFLARELFSHMDANEGFVKVNADCSDEEVNYVVSQIRAHEAK